MSTTVESALHDGSSVLKQAVLARYARGEISLDEASKNLDLIKPQPQLVPVWQRVVGFVAALVVVLLVPPWAQRRND